MQNEKRDESARRAYWREQMEAAYAFMMKMMDYPVAECGEPLASLREAAADAGIEVAFSDTKLAKDLDRIFSLRAGLIENFIAAGREMNNRGWVLKVEDGYRTIAMQRELSLKENVFDVILQRVIWEQQGCIPSGELMFRRLAALTVVFPKIGTHISGSALDISVLRRDDGAALDRGGPYLELSELTPMSSPYISMQAKRNRTEITALMARHGFIAYPYEFWHYSSADAYAEYLTKSGKPARYGAVEWVADTGDVKPLENLKEPLHSKDEIRLAIDNALARLAQSPASDV